MYFVNSKKFPLHFDFCRDKLGYNKTQKIFNQEQYGFSKARMYILFSVNYYVSCGKYTIEYFAGDQVTIEQIEDMYNRVESRVYFGGDLYFMPTSQVMDQKTKELVGKIPVISSNVIFSGQNYQALNIEKGYGYLRKIDVEEIDNVYLSRHEIVLTNGVPNNISVVSGIITTDFQTPLSHINVLSRNRCTPNMALRDGWTNPYLSKFVNKLVFFHVKSDTFVIYETNLQEAEKFWAKKEPKDIISPPCNDYTPGLFEMSELDHGSISLVGAKVANFAEMTKIQMPYNIDPIPVPEGAFAIPFFYYRLHIMENSLDTVIDNMLKDLNFNSDIAIRKNRLNALRSKIKDAPINRDFLNMVINKVKSNNIWIRMRFRSSTNAEDLKGFNGAGLYDSKTGDLKDIDKPIDKAIKKVWASLWNFRAYEEREYFKIVHKNTAMVIMVHRSFPDEIANGVAITRNIMNPNLYGYTINVQVGEISIVFPPKGVICDQMVFYTFHNDDPYKNPAIEYISHSSELVDGKLSVLSQKETVELAKYLSI